MNVDGDLVVRCASIRAKDGSICTQETKISQGGAEKKMHYANLISHLQRMHSGFLNAAHIKEATEAAVEVDKESAAAEFSDDDIKKERRQFVMFCAAGGLPLALTDSMAWKFYAEQHKIPVIPRTTLRRQLTAMREELIVAPVLQALKAAQTPIRVNAGGFSLSFRSKVNICFDGFSTDNGSFLSVVLQTFRVVLGAQGKELRPVVYPLGLFDYPDRPAADDGDAAEIFIPDHSADAQAMVLEGALAKFNLTPRDVLRYVHDTTNTNPSTVLKSPQLALGGPYKLVAEGGGPAGPLTGDCYQHVYDLVAEDLDKDVIFKSAISAAGSMSVFLRASAQRMNPLLQKQTESGVPHPVKPIQSVPTRFFTKLLVARRLKQLQPFISQLPVAMFSDKQEEGKQSARKEFTSMLSSLSSWASELDAVLEMTLPMLSLVPRLGSQSAFTASLRDVLLEQCVESAIAENVKEAIPSTARALTASLFRRLASLAILQSKDTVAAGLGVTAPPPKSMEFERRIHHDNVSNLAKLLDPAISSTVFLRTGGNVDHATAFGVQILMSLLVRTEEGGSATAASDDGSGSATAAAAVAEKQSGSAAGTAAKAAAGGKRKASAAAAVAPAPPLRASPFTSAPAAASAAWAATSDIRIASSLYKSFEDEMTAINALKKGALESADNFKKRVGDATKDARKRWGKTPGGARSDDPVGGDDDTILEDALTKQLTKEVEQLVAERKSWAEGAFGDPLAPRPGVPENLARYTYWPGRQAQWPLLYVLACNVLASCPATSTPNESLHSVVAYIMRKQRNCLTRENMETFALSRVLLPQMLKASKELAQLEAEAFVSGVVDEEAVDSIVA